VLPHNHRLSPRDLVLSLDCLASIYPLTIALASLFSSASLALVTAGCPTADFDLAFQNVSPTVVIASAQTVSQAHDRKKSLASGLIPKIQQLRRAQLLQAGRMHRPDAGTGYQGLRLIYAYDQSGSSVPLDSIELNDVRILTGARIVYGLANPYVAGAVCQTNMLDYRVVDGEGQRSHFGAPLGCVEVKLVDTPGLKVSDEEQTSGQMVVSGPAVVGGTRNLGLLCKINDDGTISLIS
jgi:hypothetical protein